MKKDLRFIKGAISTKDFVPALKHVHIKDGVAQAFNGSLSLNTPINIDVDVVPHAADFIKAVEMCKNEPQLTVSKAGRLKIEDGSFKVFIKTITEESYPTIKPDGDMIKIESDLQLAFKSLSPFIGSDATRAWSAGIIIKGGYAYATNNVVLACHTRPVALPNDLIVPVNAIKEVIRIGEPVLAVQLSKTAITFHFEGDRWLRSCLIDSAVPDFGPVLSKCNYDPSSMQAIPDTLAEKLERLKPFMDPKTPTVIMRKTGIFTCQDDDGASDTEFSFPLSVFRYEPAYEVSRMATHWNLSYYPQPCPFISDNVSGVIIGQRLNHVKE